jgi:hypothetical protein
MNSFTYKVICYFNRPISWTKDSDSLGLTHEQGHFNIAELFARKLRKKFLEYKFNASSIKTDLKLMFDNNNKERAKMDALYDKETNFSRDKIKQIYWNKKIILLLKKFEAYQG